MECSITQKKSLENIFCLWFDEQTTDFLDKHDDFVCQFEED